MSKLTAKKVQTYTLEINEHQRLFLLVLLYKSTVYDDLYDTLRGKINTQVLFDELEIEGSVQMTQGDWQKLGEIANSIEM